MSTSPPGSRRSLALAALLTVCFAVWLHGPTLGGGLLSDDLLLAGYVATPGADGFATNWQRVANDFTGPWCFVDGHYYRPLVTLSLVLEHWLGGGAAWTGHAAGIGLLATSVLALAILLGMLFGPLAACIGGCWLAAHPLANESVCWPSTRADTMVLTAGLLACVAFVRHLRGAPGRPLLWAHVAAVTALLCKESGLLLAVWLLLIDLGARPRGATFRQRLRPHLTFVPIWVLYLGWRSVVLPGLAADAARFLQMPGAEVWMQIQWQRFGVFFAPHGSLLAARTPFTVGMVSLVVIAGGLATATTRRWTLLGFVWLLLSQWPSHLAMVGDNLVGGRFVLLSLAGLALVVAAVLGGPQTPRWLRGVGLLLLLPALFDLTAATRALQREYQRNWDLMQQLRADVDAAGERATAAAPLVMLTTAPDSELMFLHANQAFALAEPPLARADHAFVGLGTMLEVDSAGDMLRGEAGPWRAMWQHGANLCFWYSAGSNGRFERIPRPGVPPVELVAGATGFDVAGGASTPFAIGGIEVRATAPFQAGELTWRAGGGATRRRPIGPGEPGPGGFIATVDLLGDFEFLFAGSLGGITGFAAELTSPAGAVVAGLQVVPPPPPAPLGLLLRGGVVPLVDLWRRLPVAALPPLADPGSVAAVLMNKACAFRVRHTADGRLELPARARHLLTELDRFARSDRVYYYLECTVGGRPWRSEVDWFERDLRR